MLNISCCWREFQELIDICSWDQRPHKWKPDQRDAYEHVVKNGWMHFEFLSLSLSLSSFHRMHCNWISIDNQYAENQSIFLSQRKQRFPFQWKVLQKILALFLLWDISGFANQFPIRKNSLTVRQFAFVWIDLRIFSEISQRRSQSKTFPPHRSIYMDYDRLSIQGSVMI